MVCVAMKALDPHLGDGVHEWRDGQKVVKDGDKLYLQGTNTLAGRSVFFPRKFPPWTTVFSEQLRPLSIASSQWINAFATCRGSRVALWARRSSARRLILPSKPFLFEIHSPSPPGSSYRCLGIEDRKGTLRPGADADLVVLDRDGYVLGTYVKGKKVWSSS